MKTRPKRFIKTFRSKIIYGFLLHIVLLLSAVLLFHLWEERQIIQKQLQLAPLEVGDILVGSLQHAWMINDFEMVDQVVDDIGSTANIEQVQIISYDNIVVSDSQDYTVGSKLEQIDSGCIECHQFSPEHRPRVAYIQADNRIRITTPIVNPAECTECHSSHIANVGVVLIDVPPINLQRNLNFNLILSVLTALVMAIGIYLLINYFITRRLDLFHSPIEQISAGDFSARVPLPKTMPVELKNLARTFNKMASQLDHHIQENERLTLLRHRMIIEERERIARELHDGFGQVLTFISTKSTAMRIMLQKQKSNGMEKHLQQVEKAAQDLLIDLRMVVVGLRIASQIEEGLTESLKGFVDKFNHLSEIPVNLNINPKLDQINLDSETELQIFRIIQEALNNIYKHSEAQRAWVKIEAQNGNLIVEIGDDGKGFEILNTTTKCWANFGLTTMKERAALIGANFDLESRVYQGTQIKIKIPVKGDK
jgi:signal transduction histidine kinase